MRLSVVLSTKNEEDNITACLLSVKKIADEIVIFDEGSTDKTRNIARKHGAKVFKVKHEPIFHITKQKAIDKATGDWILQLDADERVTPELAKEIKEVINLPNDKLTERKVTNFKNQSLINSNGKAKLFKRHQKLIKEREGGLGKQTGEVVAFFIPRLNFFVNQPLRYAGVYPDAVIRLFKKGKAKLPGKSVHELMEIDGEVAWLFNDLAHHESPTLDRYLARANRYTDLTAKELARKKVPKTPLRLIDYSIYKPLITFGRLFFRHKGYKDGMRGFLWSVFSSWHFPLSYWKYWVGD